jgi:hypothetical protein
MENGRDKPKKSKRLTKHGLNLFHEHNTESHTTSKHYITKSYQNNMKKFKTPTFYI